MTKSRAVSGPARPDVEDPQGDRSAPEPRVRPIRRDEWTAETRRALGALADRDPLDNVFATLAQYPDLLRRYSVFGTHILRKSTLSARAREFAILRIGVLNGCEYEFAQHARIGIGIGIDESEIRAVRTGSAAPGWSDEDRLVLQAAEELFCDGIISDETWYALADSYNQEQMMDLTYTIGCYNMISWALNSFRVQPDPTLPMWGKAL